MRMKKIPIECRVNGEDHVCLVDPRDTLLELLRDRLNLTGTKEGCSNGNCGACTVLVDGDAVCACLMMGTEAPGHEITTIEGLSKNGELHPLQQAWVEHGVPQCGYCQSGQIMTAAHLLEQNPSPSEDDIVNAMAGNLCRCGTYHRIVEAVKSASST